MANRQASNNNTINANTGSNKSPVVQVSGGDKSPAVAGNATLAELYANLSKQYAFGEGIINGEDYSSKTYSIKSKEYADEAKSYIQEANNTLDDLQGRYNEYNGQLMSTTESGKREISSSKEEALESLQMVSNEVKEAELNVLTAKDETVANANFAKQWATSEIIVEDTDYSAKYYAEKAKDNSGIFYDELTEEDIDVDIISGDYVTRTELENGLATKQDVGVYLTQETDPIYTADKPTLALKSELPDTSNFVTNDDFQGQLNTKQPKGDYALKSELPNLTNYATKTELDAKQNRLAATGTNRIPVYCDGYILKPVVALSAELVSGGFTKEVYYAHHPEMSEMHILPFIYNDFAFIDKKGGSYTVTRNDDGEIGNPQNIFDAAPSFMHSRGFTSDTVWTVDITAPKNFAYGTLLYVDFGPQGFACSYVKIEAQHATTGEWKTVLEKSDISLPYVYCRCNSDDIGVNKFKFTFKNPLSPQQFRISSIGAISYKSAGVEETMLTLKGGTVYGDVIAPNITKLQNEVEQLKTTIANMAKTLGE